ALRAATRGTISLHPKSITDLRSGVEKQRGSREVQRSTFARFLGLSDFRLLQQYLHFPELARVLGEVVMVKQTSLRTAPRSGMPRGGPWDHRPRVRSGRHRLKLRSFNLDESTRAFHPT